MAVIKKEEFKYFEFLPGALIEVDLTSRSIIFMNRIAFSLFNFDQKDIENGLALREIFFTDAEYERSIRVAESFGLESYQNHTAYSRYEKQDLYDFKMRKKDGSYFLGECQGSFVLDEHDVPVGARIYIRDLSEQRQLEASHIENEEKYRTLVENSSDLIFLVDTQGVILSINKATTQYLKRKTEEVEGKNVSDIFPAHTTNTIMGYLNKAFISNKSLTLETPMPMTNKTEWISTSVNPVRDVSGNVTAILGISRNITERRRSDERLEQALIDAQNANKVKDQFISNITHEIRTPMTTITGFAGRLKQSLGEDLKPAEEDYFKFINHASDRLLRTVDALINVSQLEAGTLKLNPKRLHLGQLIELLCEKHRAEATEKQLEIEYIQLTDDDEIWYDEHTVYQAINNIMLNGIKYTEKGGVSIKLERIKKQLYVTFTDTGIGISDDYRDRLFQLFTQESEGLTKEYQGIGLGLALAKKYLDLNEVEIKVDSQKGWGSTFTLIFHEHFPLKEST